VQTKIVGIPTAFASTREMLFQKHPCKHNRYGGLHADKDSLSIKPAGMSSQCIKSITACIKNTGRNRQIDLPPLEFLRCFRYRKKPDRRRGSQKPHNLQSRRKSLQTHAQKNRQDGGGDCCKRGHYSHLPARQTLIKGGQPDQTGNARQCSGCERE